MFRVEFSQDVLDPPGPVLFFYHQMGVSPGWGGGARLVGIVGRRAALRLLAWSPPMTATDGLAIGLLDAVAAEEGGAREEAEEFLRGVLKHEAYGKLLRKINYCSI